MLFYDQYREPIFELSGMNGCSCMSVIGRTIPNQALPHLGFATLGGAYSGITPAVPDWERAVAQSYEGAGSDYPPLPLPSSALYSL